MGKTTIVTNLAAGLTQQGLNVLLIDCDAQGNLQNQFNVKTEKTLVDLLLEGEVEVASVRPRLDLINSGKQQLAETELSLSGRAFRETILKERLKTLNGYDYVFCDLSPTVTLVNTNQVQRRDVIVQGGAYAEHQILSVSVDNKTYPVNQKYFPVRLEPGAGTKLIIHRKRFANVPTFAFHWHGDKVPLHSNPSE